MYFIADPFPSQKSKEVRQFCHKIGTTLRLLEESTQWANRYELNIGSFKESIRKDTHEANSPLVFLDYCAEGRVAITNMTVKNLFQLQGKNAHTATYREQRDIFIIFQLGWCKWVYARDGYEPFTHMTEILDRCIGPARNEGNELTQWILNINMQVVP